MDNSHVLVSGNHQVNGEKPPPQTCPRCNSDNTRFCYYNNYSLAQPRYTCKNCRRLWTHGGTVRNLPIGVSVRKTRRPRIDQPSVAQVVPIETQHVNHHQPFVHDQETNNYLGSMGGSSAAAVVENHFGSLPENHGDMVFPVRSHPPMDRHVFNDGSFPQGYYHVGSSVVVGNPLTDQSIGGHVNNFNNYSINQEDPNKPRQSFKDDTMSKNHNASLNQEQE